MANTTPFYARIDTDLKNKAEAILEKMGVSPAFLLTMVYSQIVINERLPFDVSLHKQPVDFDSFSEEDKKKEIEKGLASLDRERTYTPEEVVKIVKGIYRL